MLRLNQNHRETKQAQLLRLAPNKSYDKYFYEYFTFIHPDCHPRIAWQVGGATKSPLNNTVPLESLVAVVVVAAMLVLVAIPAAGNITGITDGMSVDAARSAFKRNVSELTMSAHAHDGGGAL